MKLLSLKQASCRNTDVVYRASPTANAINTGGSLGLTILAGYLLIHGRIGSFNPPRFIAAGSMLFFLLFTCVFARIWKASRRSTNWIVRIQGNQVLIKFRSYQNWKLSEDDLQVAVLDQQEIAFVRQSMQRQITTDFNHPNEPRRRVDRRIYLEIGLKDGNTTALTMAADVAKPGWGNNFYRSKTFDYPVRAERGVIRIAWRNGSTLVRPRIKYILAELGRHTTIAEPENGTEDFTPSALKRLPPDEQRRWLGELARRDEIAAALAAKKLFECSLAEATRMVRALASSGEKQTVSE